MDSQEVENQTLHNMEFETKFRVEGDLVYPFKRLVENLPDLEDFIYVESDDIYYVDPNGEFARYRFSKNKLDTRAEVTWKSKLPGSNNNIKRIEYNWRVDGTPADAIAGALELKGFTRNFRISKIVHIYRFKDATIPFYTVIDESGKMAHFIEIEVKEELLTKLTDEQAWEIISKWEKILSPLGITPQKRLRKSLFEIYKQ